MWKLRDVIFGWSLRLHFAVVLALFQSTCTAIPSKVRSYLALLWKLERKDVTLKLPTFLLFALFASSIERIGRCAAEEGRHFQQPNHRHPVAISHRSLSYPSLLRKLSFATQGQSILLLRQEHIQLFNICIQRNSFLVICEIFDIVGLWNCRY